MLYITNSKCYFCRMKMWRAYLMIGLIGCGSSALAQGIRDSVFVIQQFSKYENRTFKKEEAGMKQTQVDSFVLMNSLNVDLAGLLGQNSTIYIKSNGRGALATASIRGTAATHSKVTWNGMRIDNPMTGMVDFSNIPIFVVDDVNIQYGGASISENGGALGGNINLSNKPDWSNRFSGRVLGGIGSYSTYDALGQVNFGNEKVQSKTRIYYKHSLNDYTFLNPGQVNDDAFQNTGDIVYTKMKKQDADYGQYGLLQEVYCRFATQWTASAKVWLQDGSRYIPMPDSYEGAATDTAYRTNVQDDVTRKAIADFNYYGDKLKAKVFSGFDYQELDYVMKIKVSGGDVNKPVDSHSKMKGWYNHGELEYNVSDNYTLKASVDVNHFDVMSIDSTLLTGYDEKRFEYSAFAGFYGHIIDPVNVSLEVRQDKVPNTSPPLVYNVGVSYRPFDNIDLVWKNSFNRNFHSPSLNDLYWLPGGNPNLLPEDGYGGESGLHYVLENEKRKLETQVTGYYSDIDNWILWTPTRKGYWEAQNVKHVISWGIEVNENFKYTLGHWTIQANANYAYTSTKNEGDPIGENDASVGGQLPYIPMHTFNAILGLTYKSTFINFQNQTYGKRYLMSSGETGYNDDSESADNDSYSQLYPTILHYLTLGHTQSLGHYKLQGELKVYNLFDETYRGVLKTMMPGRNYEFLLTFKF